MDNHHRLSEDLERVIMKDDTSSSVTTEEDPHIHEYRTFRDRLCSILHSHRFQVVIVSLVIFDCLLVIAELLIDMRIVEIKGKDDAHQHDVTDADLVHLVHITKVLHYLSITVLTVFLVELLAKFYAFRLDFFRHKIEIFDGLVVVVSFGLDVAFSNQHSGVVGLELLIILRLWRVTRILNGIVMSVKKQAERKLHRERRVKEAVEQELAKFREYCAAQEREIEALKVVLRKNGIDISACETNGDTPVLINKMDVVAEVNQINEKNDKYNNPSAPPT